MVEILKSWCDFTKERIYRIVRIRQSSFAILADIISFAINSTMIIKKYKRLIVKKSKRRLSLLTQIVEAHVGVISRWKWYTDDTNVLMTHSLSVQTNQSTKFQI